MRTALPALALAALVSLVACGGSAPRAIVLHEEQCNYCRMEISDARFGTEVITNTGKVHVFDSVECLAGFVRAAAPATLRAIWVTDAATAGRWVRADEAGYLLDSSLRGPMGRVVAFASSVAATEAQARLGGTTLSWAAIVADSAGVMTPAEE